jgi:hypothetical protein
MIFWLLSKQSQKILSNVFDITIFLFACPFCGWNQSMKIEMTDELLIKKIAKQTETKKN